MTRLAFYRYVSQGELSFVRAKRVVKSRNPQGITYFTTGRYDDPAQAQRLLALAYLPFARIGPLSADEMSDFDAVPLRPVGGRGTVLPGGAVEAATTKEVYLPAVYEFQTAFRPATHSPL